VHHWAGVVLTVNVRRTYVPIETYVHIEKGARGLDDGARTAQLIRGAEGKRLRYREPVRAGRPF